MVGGMFEMKGPDFANVPEHWLTYIAVDDVDARLKKATDAGAKVLKEPFDIPGVGRMAVLMEPGGATVAWMTPKPMR
jgi:predicted enzyme related to lactoylglutathione lyase